MKRPNRGAGPAEGTGPAGECCVRASRKLFGRPGLQWLAFCLGLVLFLWPYLSDGVWPSELSYAFFFSCWGLLVLFLAWSGRAPRGDAGRRERPEAGGRS